MYPVVLVVLVLSYGCRACVITGHPEDTVAEVGENATLTCTTDFTICQYSSPTCLIHWQRETIKTFEVASFCDSVYAIYPYTYSVSSGPDWSFIIISSYSVGLTRARSK